MIHNEKNNIKRDNKQERIKSSNLFLYFILFTFFIFTILNSNLVFSSSIEVLKIHSEKIDTNENFDFALQIRNLENQDLKLKIYDNLVFNNNGLNIECYELFLPKNSTIVLNYSNIYEFYFNVPGIYKLNSTKIVYDLNGIKKEETVYETEIEVIGETKTSSQIINVYQCDNMRSINMQTVSSNSGNFMVNLNSGGININNYNPLKELEESNDLTTKEIFKNNLLETQKIQDLINEEIKKGYSFDSVDVNAINETTGVFNIIFKDIRNQKKIISGTSDNLIIIVKDDSKKKSNQLILPIFLIFFLIWVFFSMIYLFLFKKKIKNDNIVCLFKPKLKKDLLKYKNEDIFICNNNEKCNVKELIKEISDLEEKSEIVTFVKNNKDYINNEDYKKLIYKKLSKKEIKELKEMIISSLKDYNKKV